jgi:predicted metal-dependent peptidase
MSTKITDKKTADQITKAIAAIVLDDPFYGYMLLRQEIIEAPNSGTAATNGFRISYDPEFMKKLSLAEIKGVLKHEVMHIASMHHLRRQNRDPKKWNIAADYVINALLVEEGVTLPQGVLADAKYKDFSTEHVYEILPDNKGNGGNDGSNESDVGWNIGGVEDAPGIQDPATRDQIEQDTKVDVIQAANAAKLMGKLPAHIERLVDSIRESRMPWRQILARFFRATAKADYSWLRPNRRFLASGLYLPSLHSDSLGPVVVAVDTSGSVGGEELEQFFGCINAILRQAKPEAVHVVYCDAEVQNIQVFRERDYPIKLNSFKPKGGGGTDFRPVFKYVKDKRLNPEVLLYLTDMHGAFPSTPSRFPTIWCATSKEIGPFGKTIEIK